MLLYLYQVSKRLPPKLGDSSNLSIRKLIMFNVFLTILAIAFFAIMYVGYRVMKKAFNAPKQYLNDVKNQNNASSEKGV